LEVIQYQFHYLQEKYFFSFLQIHKVVLTITNKISLSKYLIMAISNS
ncbi:uncharacterized protein METZ01_LOCUS222175, partial [marine metagenome]